MASGDADDGHQAEAVDHGADDSGYADHHEDTGTGDSVDHQDGGSDFGND